MACGGVGDDVCAYLIASAHDACDQVVLRWNRAMQTGSHSSSAVLGATYLLVAANVVVTLIAVIESCAYSTCWCSD